MMTNINWKDVLIRALKTFVQAAASCLIASLSGVDFTAGGKAQTFWIGLVLSACAAGISAAWNGILQPVLTAGKTGDAGGQ